MKMPHLLLYFSGRLIAWMVTKGLFSLEIRGRQHLEQLSQGPLILAGNHQGWLDSLFVMAACRRPLRFLVADFIFDWPVVGKFLKWSGMIGIRRCAKTSPDSNKKLGAESHPSSHPTSGDFSERQALKACIEHVVAGEALCIFPEGKLTLDGEMNPFGEGVALVQQQAQKSLGQPVPILPFALNGAFEAWPYGRRYPWPTKVTITFGPPVLTESFVSRSMLTQRLYQRIDRLRIQDRVGTLKRLDQQHAHY